MKVLFLSASTGGGHYKAAEALYEQIELYRPSSGSLIIDALKEINPQIDRLIVNSYLGAVKNAPFIYSTLYKLAESGQGFCNAARNLNGLLSGKLLNLIRDIQPSAIVCTHTLPLQMLSCLKAKGRLDIPVIAVVTDFSSHMFWRLDGIDAFIVAHESIRQDMAGMGIPAEKIHTFGIPVSSNFLKKTDKAAVLGELGLLQKPTFLVMGGSLGLGCVEQVFESLLNMDRDIQVIAVAGRNVKLKERLEHMASGSRTRARVFGYTDRIPDLLGVSDYFVTKPGGMAISEALVKHIPILLLPPLPGQEERNADFLTGMGAAIRLLPGGWSQAQLGSDECIRQITGEFASVLDHPLKAKGIKEKALQLARPESSIDTVNLIDCLGKYNLLNHEKAFSL
jgi:processive 1,2-diacylglycerol beta-glucosyltransferase